MSPTPLNFESSCMALITTDSDLDCIFSVSLLPTTLLLYSPINANLLLTQTPVDCFFCQPVVGFSFQNISDSSKFLVLSVLVKDFVKLRV